MSAGIVWVLEHLFDDQPVLLSVHTSEEYALDAIYAFMNDYRHGGNMHDYRITSVKLNETGLEDLKPTESFQSMFEPTRRK